MKRFILSALAALALIIPAQAAEQSTTVLPIVGPMSMATFAGKVNDANRAMLSCSWGTSAPANGPSGAPIVYQCWADTTTNPVVFKYYDGTSWVNYGSLNTSTHAWAPQLTNGVSGGVPYFSSTGIMASSSALAQYGFVVGGGAGVAPSTIAACTDDQIAFGRTSNSPLCRTVSGDITFASGVSAIGAAKVTSAMMRNSGALSVIGRSANSSGVPADISCTAGADGVLRESGSTLGCGTIATGGLANNAVTLAKLATQAANTVLANATSGAAVPTAFSMPSCSAAGSALGWTSNSGFNCNSAITATTNANLTGDVTSVGNATTLTNAPVIAKVLTGYTSGAGTVSSTDSILTAIQKLNGNDALRANASRNISTGCGLAGGGDLSADRTLRLSLTINAQSGTSYTVLDGDCGKLVSFNNASAVAVNLPQANVSTFVSGWSVDFQNRGAGTVTITPTTSTINGQASLLLTQNQGMHCNSDGTNYTCVLGVGSGGGSGTVTNIATGNCMTGGPITATGTVAFNCQTNSYDNKFRNASFQIWQRGTSIASVSGAYTADGWIVTSSGAALGGVSQAANTRSGALTAYGAQIVGATSVTGATIKQRIEGFMVAPFASQSVTVQAYIRNDTGGSITPTLTVKHANAADNWGASTTDVSAVSLQACANSAWTQVSYTFTANASSGNGLEVTFDFGNNFSTSGKSVIVAETDIRLGSTVVTPSFREYTADFASSQFYYQTGAFYFEGPVSSSSDYATSATVAPMRGGLPSLSVTNVGATLIGDPSASGTLGSTVATYRRRASGTGAGFYSATFTMSKEL